jgi:hypothetical protein
MYNRWTGKTVLGSTFRAGTNSPGRQLNRRGGFEQALMIRLLLLSMALISAASSLMASPIYSVTGPLIDGGAIASTQAVGVSWTQSRTYTDVVISAVVSGSVNDVLAAYLTTRIGPGTTVADEITHASVALPGNSFSSLAIVSIPLLPSGTYYLTLSSSGTTGDLAETIVPAATIDTGVTRNPDFGFSNPSGYPPDNDVLTPPIGGLFVFSATGNVATVPEPAYGFLLGAALAGCLSKSMLRP